MLSRFSFVQLFANLQTVSLQAPLSLGLSRQKYWSGLHALLQGIFPTQGSNRHLLSLLHQQQRSSPLAPPCLTGVLDLNWPEKGNKSKTKPLCSCSKDVK